MTSQNKFGLTERDMKTIVSILSSHPVVSDVHLFGSRAKGNYRLGSDVDLAIMNKGVPGKTLLKICNDFEESNLPYRIDLIDHTQLNKKEFIHHIDRVGIPFYRADKETQSEISEEKKDINYH